MSRGMERPGVKVWAFLDHLREYWFIEQTSAGLVCEYRKAFRLFFLFVLFLPAKEVIQRR